MKNYFSDCSSLAEVKERFKDLAKVHHPDKGGDTAVMQEINAQYQKIQKRGFFRQSSQKKEDYTKKEAKDFWDVSGFEAFRKAAEDAKKKQKTSSNNNQKTEQKAKYDKNYAYDAWYKKKVVKKKTASNPRQKGFDF